VQTCALPIWGFVAILFSVCNHLGDLLGVGSAKRQLRKLLFYPNIYGVPKWYTTLPPSHGQTQLRIAQVVWKYFTAGQITNRLAKETFQKPIAGWRKGRQNDKEHSHLLRRHRE